MILHQFHYNLYTSTELGQVTIVNYDLGPVYGRLVQNKVPAWTEKIVLRVGFGGQLSFLAALNRISSPVIWPNGALTRSKLCYTLLFHGQLTTLRSISIKIESLFSHCEWTRYQNTKTPQNIILSLPSLAYFSYFSEKKLLFFSYLLVLSYIFTKFPCATALFNNFRNLYIISKIISRLLQISL